MLKINLSGEDKTVIFGETIGKIISDTNYPILIYLKGDLGAGKTHLSKGIAKGLGITEDITSPTFTLINEYDLPHRKLYHLDLYRLDTLNQVLDLGIEDFIDEENNIVVIEWAEKLKDYKLSDYLFEIDILHKNNSRDFELKSSNTQITTLIEGMQNIVDSWN